MTEIMVNAELASQIARSLEPIVLRGPDGKRLGYVERPAFTDEEIREAESRLQKPGERFTTAQVLARLRALEEEGK